MNNCREELLEVSASLRSPHKSSSRQLRLFLSKCERNNISEWGGGGLDSGLLVAADIGSAA